jgi:hypothetical protein
VQTKGQKDSISAVARGTKVSPYYKMTLAPGETRVFKFRMTAATEQKPDPFADFDAIFAKRISESDQFWKKIIPSSLSEDEQLVSRQSAAGLLWSKQFYHYVVKDWLDGDPEMPKPPQSRHDGRNGDWTHLFNRDVISMPDKWEYPWFATWDLAYGLVLPLGIFSLPQFFPFSIFHFPRLK